MARLKVLTVTILIICATYSAVAAGDCPMDAKYKLPENAPMLTLNNKEPNRLLRLISFKEGTQVTARCKVEGGTPSVSSVTLKCGDHSNTEQGTQASMTFVVTKERDGETCVCKAEHPSGCYKRKSTAYLTTNYQSSITRFTANDQAQVLEVDQGQIVSLKCQADGNPSPRLDIKGRKTGNSPFGQNSYVMTDQLVWQRTATCDFADVYECTASNDFDQKVDSDKKSVEVRVKACDGASVKNDIKVHSMIITGGGNGGNSIFGGNSLNLGNNILNIGNMVDLSSQPFKDLKPSNDTDKGQGGLGNLGDFLEKTLESSLGWLDL